MSAAPAAHHCDYRDRRTGGVVFVPTSIRPTVAGGCAPGPSPRATARSVLWIQRWQSRGVLQDAMSGPRFERWWSQYQPALARWEAMLVLDSEWETIELIA